MPKEITHWLVGTKTAAALSGTLLGEAALGNQNALKFGAIFPDVLYYLPDDPAISRYRDIAHAIHGTGGEDTYDLIRQIIAAMPGSPYRQQLLAFLLGVATHIQSDAVFHPLVYYLTGNYEDVEPSRRSAAIQQHRRFECLVDLYFCGGSIHLRDDSVKSILRNLELPLSHLLELSPRSNRRSESPAEMKMVMTRAVKNFQILQGLYRKRVLARLLYAITPFLPGVAKEITALFYSPQLDSYLPRVSGTFSYRHPLTGQTKKAGVSMLLEEAVQQSVVFAGKIEASIVAEGTGGFSERGPALSYGQTGAHAPQALYLAEKPFFD